MADDTTAIKKISRKDLANMSAGAVFKSSVGAYKKLFSYLIPYKGRFALGILFGALFGMTNGLLIFVIKHTTAIIFPDPEAGAADSIFAAGSEGSQIGLEQVVLACAAVPVLMVVRGAFSYLNAYCMLWVSMRVLNDIRAQLFERLMSQSLSFFGKSKGGELIQIVFNQTRMAQQALTTVASDVIKQPISILSALAVLFYLDWKFTLVALILFPACLVPVLVVGRKVRKAGAREEQEAGLLMVVMQEAFAGIRVVKAHAREEYEQERFCVANEKMLAMLMRWRKAMEIVGPMVEAVASIGISLALVYAWMLGLPASTFIALQGGLILLYPPFKTLSRMHILLQKCLAATTKVFELMEREIDIPDKPDAIELEHCRGAIRFEDVTFTYGHSTPAVRGITLDIPATKTYALVGPSGAGKSTLLSLILRFYDTPEGTIFVDDHDLRDLKQASLRRHIGIVSQDTFLFHDTIYKNILYGRLDATREEVEEAAQRAFAHDFILAQPNGYETVIGDKGCLLSGGQQQRVSIARAILRNAPILLLDEATSALDSESERKIQVALEDLSKGKTVIAIAHRLSTILRADRIVVMEDGRIAASGTHQELLASSPIYKRLYELQFHHDPEASEPAPDRASEPQDS